MIPLCPPEACPQIVRSEVWEGVQYALANQKASTSKGFAVLHPNVQVYKSWTKKYHSSPVPIALVEYHRIPLSFLRFSMSTSKPSQTSLLPWSPSDNAPTHGLVGRQVRHEVLEGHVRSAHLAGHLGRSSGTKGKAVQVSSGGRGPVPCLHPMWLLGNRGVDMEGTNGPRRREVPVSCSQDSVAVSSVALWG